MMKSKYENLKIIYNRSKFGWYWAPVFVAFWFLLFYLTALPAFNHFPDLLTEQDELKHQGEFIGERAEKMLLQLTKIGPKVVGSAANEQVTVQFLLEAIDDIQREARTDLYDIKSDVQVASGNYVLWTMENTYQSIQNVVVKLIPKGSNDTAALLINTHFDTVPSSSGAGDAGFMVVVMLETLRVIAKYPTELKHSLVFLFNGAEENPLQGSHAFITQHEWAKNVKAFINLDSAGAGGREILFQSGPGHPWLMRHYGRYIKHPFATTIGEELFQNGFVPSETDFRIFRDFGNIPGLDMAHIFNGFIYHTKYDRFNLIPRKSYQLTGDNVLGLAKGLANAPELEDPEKYKEGHTVFYDVLGWFIICYTEATGFIMNVVVCVVAIITVLVFIWNMAQNTGMFKRRIFAKFGILFGIQLAAVLLAFLLNVAIAIFIDAVGLTMPWYSKNWMMFGLYYCPMFFMMGIFPAIYLNYTKEHGLPLGYAIQLLMHAHCLILTILAIVMISFGIRSTYHITISIGFYILSVIINLITCFHKSTFYWLIPHIICQIMPFMFLTYVCLVFYMTFIAMEGRESNSNPDLLIAAFTAFMCLLFAPYLVPLLCLFRKAKIIISLFGVTCLIFIILAATAVGFPYVERDAPQRFYALHTTRTFHNADAQMSVRRMDSGYYVVPVDRRTNTIDDIFDNTNLTIAGKEDCETELMCGYPIFSSRWFGTLEQSFWVPGPEPVKEGWPKMKILKKESSSATTLMYTLQVQGPGQMSIFIKPVADAQLVDWSFDKKPITENFTPPYYIYLSYALDPSPFVFYLEIKRDSADWVGPSFDIAVIGHKLYDNIHNTEEFRDFLSLFPAWTFVNSWTASYESWRI